MPSPDEDDDWVVADSEGEDMDISTERLLPISSRSPRMELPTVSKVETGGSALADSSVHARSFSSEYPDAKTNNPSVISSFTNEQVKNSSKRSIISQFTSDNNQKNLPSSSSLDSSKQGSLNSGARSRPRPRPAYKGKHLDDGNSSNITSPFYPAARTSDPPNSDMIITMTTTSTKDANSRTNPRRGPSINDTVQGDLYSQDLAERIKMRSRGTSVRTPVVHGRSDKKIRPKSLPIDADVIELDSDSDDELAIKPSRKVRPDTRAASKPAKRPKISHSSGSPLHSQTMIPVPSSSATFTLPIAPTSTLPPSDPPSTVPTTVASSPLPDSDVSSKRKRKRPAARKVVLDDDEGYDLGLNIQLNALPHGPAPLATLIDPGHEKADSPRTSSVKSSNAKTTTKRKRKDEHEQDEPTGNSGARGDVKGGKKARRTDVDLDGYEEAHMKQATTSIEASAKVRKRQRKNETNPTLDAEQEPDVVVTVSPITDLTFSRSLPPGLVEGDSSNITTDGTTMVDDISTDVVKIKGKGSGKGKSKQQSSMADDTSSAVVKVKGKGKGKSNQGSSKKKSKAFVVDSEDEGQEDGHDEVARTSTPADIGSAKTRATESHTGDQSTTSMNENTTAKGAEEIEKENIRVHDGKSEPPPQKLLPRSYTVKPKTTPMSELIRKVNSLPGSPFAASASSPHPLLKSSKSALRRIAPLHPNRRTPPPPPPRPPKPKEKKTKRQLELEEQWDMELEDNVPGWFCMTDEERAALRKAKRDREMGYGED